jgi:hypothetical protein
MNSKQKLVITIGIILIAITAVIWLLEGGDFFTKTQILVEKEASELDSMLGIPPQKEFKDSFVFGLVPPGLTATAEMISVATVAGLIVVISGLLFFKFKTKKSKEIINENNT